MIEKLDDVIYADGWDDCLVGHGTIFHGSEGQLTVAIYDRDKRAQKLAKSMLVDHVQNGARTSEMNDDQFYLEAEEYIDFNITGAFYKPGMPVFATFREE